MTITGKWHGCHFKNVWMQPKNQRQQYSHISLNDTLHQSSSLSDDGWRSRRRCQELVGRSSLAKGVQAHLWCDRGLCQLHPGGSRRHRSLRQTSYNSVDWRSCNLFWAKHFQHLHLFNLSKHNKLKSDQAEDFRKTHVTFENSVNI